MRPGADQNLQLLRTVAERLGPLRDRVVFLGGAAAGLLITDPAAETVRPTDDVDVIIEVATTGEYRIALHDQLISLGFVVDTSEGAPICRWVVAGIKVDIMPTDPSVLGFSNRWYTPAILNAVNNNLPDGPTIRVVSAPYFIVTKLEAFRGRGEGDFAASHDLEDLVAVVDGRAELAAEVEAADVELRDHLRHAVGQLLDTRDFQDALPGHLRGNAASQGRLQIVVARLEQIAGRRRS
jgi:hypothetical protein